MYQPALIIRDFVCTVSLCMEMIQILWRYIIKKTVKRFVEYIEKEAQRLYRIFLQKAKILLTEKQQHEYNNATKCHICMKSSDDPQNNRKVCNHCHFTGLYRGAAHNNCNINYKVPNHIPTVFHYLSGYGAHFFIRELGKNSTQKVLNILQKTRKNTSVLALK